MLLYEMTSWLVPVRCHVLGLYDFFGPYEKKNKALKMVLNWILKYYVTVFFPPVLFLSDDLVEQSCTLAKMAPVIHFLNFNDEFACNDLDS